MVRMSIFKTLTFSLFCLCELSLVKSSSLDNGLLLVTIATEETDGFKQYMRSAKHYDLDVKVFGLGQEWRGGDMQSLGGAHKINILKEELEEFKDREDLILLFTDSYDVVLTDGPEEILEKFKKFDARVVFSAEGFCWPDKSLAVKYPAVKAHEKPYLCSGGFIGYAKDIYEILHHHQVLDSGDDQLYYTKIFLDETLRERWSIKLDSRMDLFINLHGTLDEVKIKYKGSHSFLYNMKTGTVPIVVHGNGPIKVEFNRMANYLADGWTTNSGCLSCNEDLVNLDGLKEDDYPLVVMGIFVEKPVPFLEEFLEKITALNYPKQRIDILIHSAVEMHQKHIGPFLEASAKLYKSINILNPSDHLSEENARNWGLEECMKKDCQYYFNVDAECHLDNPQVLQELIKQNRSVVGPAIERPGKMWSNFWGALSSTGFYARSDDYIDIVEDKKIGLWNVPYLSGVYLIQRYVLPQIQGAYKAHDLDPDMAFCRAVRDKGRFLYVSNRKNFGHLIDADNFVTSHINNELYEIFSNPKDWQKRYIHENYSHSLQADSDIPAPCPDVYWFPIVTERFCDELIEEMEAFGQWSGGSHDDPRLSTGYENVPTDDIHMNQIGMEQNWLQFLDKFVAPLATRVFTGYYSNPPRSMLNFVVKYNPKRQKSLRPHHDSSTFTINIALNNPGIDFEGGGCRFIRYNCSVVDTKKGWMLMHPGRLTHFHEGLPTTKGTRYIMISFVDP